MSVGNAKLVRGMESGGELGTTQADLNADAKMEQLEFGKYEEILLITHGGAHNDTICVAQRKDI